MVDSRGQIPTPRIALRPVSVVVLRRSAVGLDGRALARFVQIVRFRRTDRRRAYPWSHRERRVRVSLGVLVLVHHGVVPRCLLNCAALVIPHDSATFPQALVALRCQESAARRSVCSDPFLLGMLPQSCCARARWVDSRD